MTESKEPLWLNLNELLLVHELLLVQFAGAIGIRDRDLLESALAKPRNYWLYEKADLHELAANYAYGIINNHPFVDGNKRSGLVAAILFLESNGLSFTAPEEEAVNMTLGLADKSITLNDYAFLACELNIIFYYT